MRRRLRCKAALGPCLVRMSNKSNASKPSLSSSVLRSTPAWLALAIAVAACGKKGAEGIEECDKYFKSVETCANEDEKGALKQGADLEKEAWAELGSEEVKTACVERAKYAKDRCDVGPEGVAPC